MKIFLLATIWVMAAAADPCPDRIEYTNGNYLKRGDYYYYQNGNYLLRNQYLYYPTGTYLKRDNTIYYSNGNYLQRDSNLYYPNGNYLKRGDYYYYANGNYLKRDSNFYYENGMYARRNGKLYRPDGTETAFPISLSEEIASHGYLLAEVKAQSEWVDVDFRDLVAESAGTELAAIWTGQAFTIFEARLNTGVVGEDVFVRIDSVGVHCSLGDGLPVPPLDGLQLSKSP